jgi:outer membrane protein insertion porin family
MIFFFLTLSLESKNYQNVLINGNERISNETVLLFSEIPADQSLDENSINIILKNLYKTGFFKDVNINFKNNDLIINLIENPIIQTVFIEGIKRKKTEEAIYEILNLKNRSAFNDNLAKKDQTLILNYLKNLGFYFSTISSNTEDLGDNKVNVYYNINLGSKARVKKISFVGDKKFKDNKLRNVIVSEEYKIWKIVSGKKFLNEKMINLDERLLTNFYKNKGFFNVNINSSFADYLGDDKFELIYNISAGKKYFFNEINLKLPLDYNENDFVELNSLFAKLKGKAYSLDSINDILDKIDKIVLSEQYEFLKASVNEEVNGDLINFTFNINESEKYYVEQINIIGNNITQENVIRNNLSVDEGDAFNELLHTKTINNLKSLNFFSNVESEITAGSSINQKIINISVDEKPTGEISAGAGVGTNGGTVGFGIKENNFLGRGIGFGSDLSFTKETVKGIISLNNPNYNGSNRSLNLSVQSIVTDRLANYGYKSNKTGFTMGSRFEYYDDLYLDNGFSVYSEKLSTSSKASTSIKQQEGSYFDTFFNYTLDYDKRNQKYQTTDGYRSKFTQKIPLINKSNTLTNEYDYKMYSEWWSENIASLSFYITSSNSMSGKDVKLSDRLFLPTNKLRGFEAGKFGPKDGLEFIGGNYASAFNLSTTLPQVLPSLQNIDISLYFDAANVWGVDYNSSLSNGGKIRSSVGVAIDFFTPIGPLNFSFSEVITKDTGDVVETFRFNLGTSF